MKEIVWLGSSKVDLKAFPAAVMDDVGHQLFLVRCGLDPDELCTYWIAFRKRASRRRNAISIWPGND